MKRNQHHRLSPYDWSQWFLTLNQWWCACRRNWFAAASVWLFPAWSTTSALVSRWERDENATWVTVLVQLLVKRCHVQPYSMVTERVWVYIHVWCVAFACVCSVCRQIPWRLSRFERRSRANSRLTGAPSSHGRQRWRQLRWARYEHVPHQSWERDEEHKVREKLLEVWWKMWCHYTGGRTGRILTGQVAFWF